MSTAAGVFSIIDFPHPETVSPAMEDRMPNLFSTYFSRAKSYFLRALNLFLCPNLALSLRRPEDCQPTRQQREARRGRPDNLAIDLQRQGRRREPFRWYTSRQE